MCWKDTHTRARARITEVFRRRLLLRTQRMYVCPVGDLTSSTILEKSYSTLNVSFNVYKFCPKHFCQILLKLEFCRQILRNIQTLNLMKIGSVEAKLLHAEGRTIRRNAYRRTDKMKRMVAFRNYINAPKICYII
jgi:hypothetical protein